MRRAASYSARKSGGKAQSTLAVGAGVLVHVRYQLRQGDLRGGKRLEAGLKGRHEHGSGDAFTGNIGHGEYDTIVFVGFARTREHVVVVSGDGVGGARDIGNRDSGNLWRRAGQ